MAMNLQSELEPLLARLSATARDKYFAVISQNYPGTDGIDVINEMEGDFRRNVEPALSSLVARFRGYYTLDGHAADACDLDPLADLFATPSDRWETPTGGSVYCHVAQAATSVDDVAKLVNSEQWYGPAAMAFHDHFLVPFKTTAVVHATGARELATAAKALAEAVERAKEYVVYVCKRAIGGYPDQLPGEEGGEGGVKKGGGIVAVLADAVSFFSALLATEKALYDVALAGAGLVGGLVAESQSAAHGEFVTCDEVRFDWGVPENAFDGVFQALDALDSNVAALDEKITRGLAKDLGQSGPFGRPDASIASTVGGSQLGEHGGPGSVDVAPSAYQHMTIAADPGARDRPGDPLVAEVVRLYEAGQVSLPEAADQYDEGVRVCAGAHIAGVRQQFPRSVSKFNEAVGTFGGLLTTMRDHLSSSGQSMVAAAKSYRFVDTHEATMIRRYESQIPAPGDSPRWTPPDWLTP